VLVHYMNLYKQTVISGGAALMIVAPKKLEKLLSHPFFDTYIPAANALIGGAAHGCRLTVTFGKRTVLQQKSSELFSLLVKTSITPEDYISIIEYVLEYFRQILGIYCIHSASVINRGKAEVFWGAATGMGKSRTATLLSKKLGMEMISDEKTLLNLARKEVVGGVQAVSLHHHYHAKQLDKKMLKFAKAARAYPIKRLHYVHNLGHHADEVEVFPWTNKVFEWHLYEELSRKIRGVSRRVDEFTTPLPSLDTEQLALARSSAVGRFCRLIECVYIRADEERVLKYFSGNV